MPKRPLTEGENAVLLIIQAGYGAHNTIDRVYFSPANEAVMFCKLANGMNAAVREPFEPGGWARSMAPSPVMTN